MNTPMRSIFHHFTHLKWSWNFEVERSGREKKMRVVCATTFCRGAPKWSWNFEVVKQSKKWCFEC
jgi:hypothetical protein